MGAHGWWTELSRLVLPVACGGCGADDERWCAACDALLGAPWRCEERAGRLDLMGAPGALPVWTVADCIGPVRAAVLAWKDHGRLDLTRPFAAALVAAGQELADVLGPGEVLVVPAPSTPASRRRRGGNLVDDLARALAAGLRAGGCRARSAPVLARRGGDQVGLGTRARWLNLAGHVRVRRRDLARVAGRRVVLVDDVLTTGATVAACRTVLEDAGAQVTAGITLAATPPPGARPVSGPGDHGGSAAQVVEETLRGLAWELEPTTPRRAPPRG